MIELDCMKAAASAHFQKVRELVNEQVVNEKDYNVV